MPVFFFFYQNADRAVKSPVGAGLTGTLPGSQKRRHVPQLLSGGMAMGGSVCCPRPALSAGSVAPVGREAAPVGGGSMPSRLDAPLPRSRGTCRGLRGAARGECCPQPKTLTHLSKELITQSDLPVEQTGREVERWKGGV